MKARPKFVLFFQISAILIVIAIVPIGFTMRHGILDEGMLFYAALVVLIAATAGALLSTFAYLSLGKQFRKTIERAEEQIEKGELKFAISALDELIEEAEEKWLQQNEAYGILGLALRKANKRDRALEMLEKQKCSIAEKFSLERIDIYLETNRWREAEKFYNEHIESGTETAYAYYGLARILAYAGKADETMKNLELAADEGFLDPELLKDEKFELVRNDPRFAKFAEELEHALDGVDEPEAEEDEK